MRILINASNLKIGGGVQVADSICRELYKYTEHDFVIVVSDALKGCTDDIKNYLNVNVEYYNLPSNLLSSLTGNDAFLDTLVFREKIEVVLTVFGPSRWVPKCLHISGFARAQLVLNDSPYWQTLSLLKRAKAYCKNIILMYLFRKSASVFYTENNYISIKLKRLFRKSRVYTVTNNYNQVFDKPDLWDQSIEISKFDGLTLLTISANYPHKNLSIIVPTILYLKKYYSAFRFRFVLTIAQDQFEPITNEVKKHIVFLGPVKINQCPYLYKQSDVMFLPTLLECFSACYAEAMKMDVPILTTDLEFARSLCGSAAFYYDSTSIESLSKAIYTISSDKSLREKMINQGRFQLLNFDSTQDRVKKLLSIIEKEFRYKN